MKTKVCHVISDIDYNNLFEVIEHFADKNKYELSFIFLAAKVPQLYEIFERRGYSVRFIRCRGRRDLIFTVPKLRRIFKEIKPDIVHTHFANASLAGLFAAKLNGIKARVHTRHHSTECHNYYPHAVYYDRIINALSAKIIAISEMTRGVLIEREHADPKKIVIIHHGLNFDAMKASASEREEVGELYDLNENYPVVGVVSRFVHLKGIQYIIPAFAELTEFYPRAKLVLAGAEGSYTDEINKLLKEHLRESQYVTILFERRVAALYANFDVFLHVPIDRESEAFGLTYVEALTMRVPSVFTISGVAGDFIEDRVNALVVPHQDSKAVFEAMRRLLEDEKLRRTIVENGAADAQRLFQGRKAADDLDALYVSMLEEN